MTTRQIDYDITPAGYTALGDTPDTTPARRIPTTWHPAQMRGAVYHLTAKAYAALHEPPPAEENTP